MDAKSKSIIFMAAVTLLLAITANATPDKKSTEPDYKFLFTHKTKATIWCAKPICNIEEAIFLHLITSSTDPPKMLQDLEEQSKLSSHSDDRRNYLLRLISYASPEVCDGISAEEFLKLFMICNENKALKRYQKFMLSYAPKRFEYCARQIINVSIVQLDEWHKHRLDTVNEYFRAALGINKLDDEMMYNRVKKVDLTKTKLNVQAMVEVASKYYPRSESALPSDPLKYMIKHFDWALFHFGTLFKDYANIVNVAQGIGVIGEKDLTPRFLLVNEYTRIAAQMDHKATYDSIMGRLMGNLSKASTAG